MNKRFWIPVAAIVVLAVLLAAVWFVDPFVMMILGMSSLVLVGAPGALAGVVMLMGARTQKRPLRPALTLLLSVAAYGAAVGLAIPANKFVHENAVLAAKAYPEQIAPLLEDYRKAHGSYPASLDLLPAKPSVPRLLRSGHGYHSSGSSYRFSFNVPGGLVDTWDYRSETGLWHLTT